MAGKQHWEDVYSTKATDSVSWYQAHASVSLALIADALPDRRSAVLDVGGGASILVNDLLAIGFSDVSVLDLSGEALAIARARLGDKAGGLRWYEGDVTKIDLPAASADLWHDRAVFHFLVEESDRKAYFEQLAKVLRPGGHVIMATFAEDGPTKCSGLPVRRYSVQQLQAEFGPAYELLSHTDEQHVTPSGNVQHFVYCHFRQRA